ncbi:unnamed protein product [Microthlaspi erraticum]|uniref:Uncharacterized protein n=1 Tax=Microthlaspi erraticum TaxID=1685480 RepID=A0A6D2K9X2_9BRAS|nr:unnamed protein product [Microthlaspi erraticum]
MFRARPNHIRPTEVSAKVQTVGRSRNDPGNIVPRSAKPNAHATAAHDQAREPGNKASRPRNSFAYHGRCIRPTGKERPTSGREFHRPNSIRSTTPADRDNIRPRSSRSPFEAQTYVFKPGLTLAASRKT